MTNNKIFQHALASIRVLACYSSGSQELLQRKIQCPSYICCLYTREDGSSFGWTRTQWWLRFSHGKQKCFGWINKGRGVDTVGVACRLHSLFFWCKVTQSSLVKEREAAHDQKKTGTFSEAPAKTDLELLRWFWQLFRLPIHWIIVHE